MLELLFVLAVGAAFRGLVQQTKRDLARWRNKPPPARGGGGVLSALKRVTAGGTGYWAHQAVHGFPTARAGLHDGWMRAVEANHQARRQIAQARAERAEGKAELIPELDELRQRRKAALAKLEEQQAERDRAAHEAWMEQNRQALAREQERIRQEAERERLRWQAEQARQADLELDRLRAERERERAGQAFSCRCCGDEDTGTGPLCGPCTAAGCARTEARDGEVAYWNCERDPAQGEPREEDLRRDQYEDEAADIRRSFEFQYCETCGKDLDRHSIGPDALGHAHAWCLDVEDEDEPMPDAYHSGPSLTEGTTSMSETTYAGVKARMTSATSAAEERQSEAKTGEAACEERVQEADSAKSWATTTAEQMQALKVDAAVLSAMADHMDALAAAKDAEDALLEAMQAAEKAWGRVLESAQQVSGQLDASGHGGVQEARDNAAGGGAEKEFYEEGAA